MTVPPVDLSEIRLRRPMRHCDCLASLHPLRSNELVSDRKKTKRLVQAVRILSGFLLFFFHPGERGAAHRGREVAAGHPGGQRNRLRHRRLRHPTQRDSRSQGVASCQPGGSGKAVSYLEMAKAVKRTG